MNIYDKLEKNIAELDDIFKNSIDIIKRDLKLQEKIDVRVYMIDGMVNKMQVEHFVIKPLLSIEFLDERPTLDYLIENIISPSEIATAHDFDKCVKAILDGDAVVFIDGIDGAIIIGAKGYNVRAASEPPSSQVIKGPREGFTEDVKFNSIQLRRKLKTPDLRIERVRVGKYSQTNVFICHVAGIADIETLDKIKNKLENIDIDGILDSSYIAQMLDENKYSLFKQIGTCEKPDILASKLLEGRIGILVDGSPIALTLPFLLFEDYQSPQDYYERAYRATLSRFLRMLSVIICVFLPGVYVAAQLYHLQLIPLKFLTKVMGSVQNIPLSPSLEMFLVILIFEILKESSVRMPKYVGMALSVVGALVLGDTAVNAGIISTPSILIAAISGICMYTIPDQEDALSVLRLLFLLFGATVGIFGIMLGALFLLVYLVSLSSYGTPYLSPFAPMVTKDLKDGIIKQPLTKMKTRPYSIKTKNHTRMK